MDSIRTRGAGWSIGDRSTVTAVLLAVVALLGATSVRADDATPLTKAEVEGIAAPGKKLQFVRTSDNVTVAYDLRGDGKAYYSPQHTQRNLSIQGSYTITDEGRLCFKWESDKYVTMQDGCYHFKREDQKIHIYRARNPDSPIGDVVQ